MNQGDRLNVLRNCECCEEAIPDGQEYVHPEDGDSYCRRCVIDLLGAERDALTRQLAGAVERAEDAERLLRVALETPLTPTLRHKITTLLNTPSGGQ